MTPEQKQAVTRWLGEKDFFDKFEMPYRRFDNPDDYFACVRKLEKLGEWDELIGKVWGEYKPHRTLNTKLITDFTQWLHGKTVSGHMRLCTLVAEWLGEKEE